MVSAREERVLRPRLQPLQCWGSLLSTHGCRRDGLGRDVPGAGQQGSSSDAGALLLQPLEVMLLEVNLGFWDLN